MIAWSGLGLDFWEDAEVQTPKRDYKNRCATHFVKMLERKPLEDIFLPTGGGT